MASMRDDGGWQLGITVLVALSAALLVLMALGGALLGVYVWPSVRHELFPLFPAHFAESEEPLPAAVPPKATLAIAPFANQSAEEGYEWLGYAFAYGTVSRLANFNELVIAGPEEMREELANEQSELTLGDITSPAAAQEAGEAVHADYVLIGNCAKSGDEIRVTAQIVEVATGNIHSERTCVREYTNMFDFHAELVRWVAEALDITTTPAGLERIEYKPTQSIPAYQCFGQGVMHYYRGEYEEAAAACHKAVDIDGDFADAYVVLAWALVCQEKHDEAVAQLKKVEELDPNRPYLHYYLGITYWHEGDYTEALNQLRRAVRAHLSDPHIRRWLGSAYHGRNQYEEAIIHYKEAIQLRPNWALPHWNIAGAYCHTGHEDKEIEEYHYVIRLCKPGETVLKSKACYSLGTTYIHNGQVGRAIDYLKKACAVRPDYVHAHFNLANAYTRAGRHQEAIDENARALALYQSGENKGRAHLGLAYSYQQLGKRQDAVEHYIKAVKLFEQCIKEHSKKRGQAARTLRFEEALDEQQELAFVKYRLSKAYGNLALVQGELGNYEASLKSANKAVELNPDNQWAYFALGDAYDDKGEYERAIAAYDRGLELCPKSHHDYVANLANRGNTYRELGEYDKALADVNQALQMRPDMSCAYGIRGRIYYEMGNYDQAKADADTALEKCPSCPGGYAVRGLLAAKEQYYEQAIAEYEKALEVGCPRDDLYTYYRLAVVYKKLGQLSTAREYVQKTLEALPEHKEAQELLDELNRLAE